MRSEQEIKGRIRALLWAELEDRLSLARRRLPERCVHNHQQRLDTRKQVDGEVNPNYNRIALPVIQSQQAIGLCMLGAENIEEWPGDICDEPVDAQRCPWFTPKVAPETIQSEFEAQLKDFSWVEENLPVVSELLWVVDQSKAPSLPWWRRLLARFRKIRIDPVQPSDARAILALPAKSDDDGRS